MRKCHVANPEETVKRHREEYERQGLAENIVSGREVLPANPPPGPKYHARQGLASMGLNGSDHDVMFCLIDRANTNTGRCFPSEAFIAAWTNREERTVRRFIASLKKRNLIEATPVKCKGGTRNEYRINWDPLFAAYKAMKAFEKARHQKREELDAGLHAEAKATVLSSLKPFDLDWLSPEGLDVAIEAELEAPGTGVGIAGGLANLSWIQSRQQKVADAPPVPPAKSGRTPPAKSDRLT
jgi:Helix-turn-helix domain